MRASLGRLGLGLILAAALPTPVAAEDARYIVQFRAGRARAGRDALRAAGGRIVLGLDAHEAVAARLTPRALARLRRNANVEHVESDPVRWPQTLWSDVSLGGETLTYGVQMVQADLVTSLDPANRTLCIVDSGYSQQHEDLKDATTGEVAFEGDSGSGAGDHDTCGHGTHVAGTAAAAGGNGVGVVGTNPGVRLHIVKVYGDDHPTGGSCDWTYSSNLVAAVTRCVAAGANVVNMSLGGPEIARAERRAFQRFHRAGVLLVASAGNGYGSQRYFPAAYPGVVSVAAVDADEVVTGFSQKNPDVELAGPGYRVISTWPRLGGVTGSGYEVRSGTSMAAPHVSAVAALLWSCHPTLGSEAIRNALTATARDLGEPGRDPAYGFGLVQAREALLSLGPSPVCTVR